MKKTKKAILYARVATTELFKKSYSLTSQINEQKLYCEKHKIKIEGIYYDLDSGISFDREEFQNLLKDLKLKKLNADYLLFSTWDRFSKNLPEREIMTKKLNEMGVKLKALREELKGIVINQSVNKSKKR